jgi:predicted RNA-binding protein YlxR (DUF448 family)
VGCGRKAPQRELVRFVARAGELALDPARTSPGRGAYTCRRLVCFERAVERRGFPRVLRRSVSVPSELKAAFEEV